MTRRKTFRDWRLKQDEKRREAMYQRRAKRREGKTNMNANQWAEILAQTVNALLALHRADAAEPLHFQATERLARFAEFRSGVAPVVPAPDDRPDGLEVLAFHRGKWVKQYGGWIMRYGGEFIRDERRAFAPLPPKPENADEFFDWKE